MQTTSNLVESICICFSLHLLAIILLPCSQKKTFLLKKPKTAATHGKKKKKILLTTLFWSCVRVCVCDLPLEVGESPNAV